MSKRFLRYQVGFDIHGDKQCKESNKVFFDFAKDWVPDIRILGGDLWDFRALRKKASDEERRESMKQDYDAGMEWLEKFKPHHYLKGNHCTNRYTDILTDSGWVNVAEINENHLVAQFDDKRNISYAKPLALIKQPSNTVIRIKGAFTEQAVTPGHDVIVDGKKVKAASLLGKKIKATSIWKSGFQEPSIPAMDPRIIRLLTWVVMDGTIVRFSKYNVGSTKKRIQFKLSYQHKINRVQEVLKSLEIPYTVASCKKTGCNVLQPYVIRVYGDWARKIDELLCFKKLIPEHWSSLPKENLATFLDELSATDGSTHDASLSWVTVDKQSADVVGLWCVRNGVDFRFSARENKSGFSNGKLQYHCAIRMRDPRSDSQILTIEEEPYNDLTYCVTMPLGTIITRLNGCVAFTGNCQRLWDLADQDRGIESDYAQQGVQEIETKCAKMGCKIYPYHKEKGILRLGHLKIVHGFSSGVYAARQHALWYGSVLMGHCHAFDSYTIPGLEPRVGRIIGSLCNNDMEYNDRQPNTLRQSNGFAYGIIDTKTGNYHVFEAKKIGGWWLMPTEFKEVNCGKRVG